MAEKKTAIGYIRVSTDEQVREGFSLENQKARIRKKCENEGWELLDIIPDEGISGASIEKRTGLKKALRLIKSKKINYLVVYKLSRLSRNIIDAVEIADLLEKNDTYLISLEDNIDTSNPIGKYFLYFASIIADMERENLIIQVKGGMSQKAREGQWNGGTPPLGYDLIDKKLVINPEEAEIVKYIFSEYVKNNGYKAIASKLNEKGYKTKKGKYFSGNSVKLILINPTYGGTIRWGHRKDWGKRDENYKRKRKYNDNPIMSEGIHEAIIDEETFNRVQDMITNNPRHHLKRFNGHHLLSGLLRCPDCGFGMSIQPVRSKGKTYEYYICNQYMNHKTCKANPIPKNKIEEEFLFIFEKIVNEPDFKNNILSSLNKTQEHVEEIQSQIKRKQQEKEKLEIKKENLFDNLSEGNQKFREQLILKIEKIIDNISSLESEVDNYIYEIEQIQNSNINLDEISEMLQNVGKILRLMDKEVQQNLIRKLISSIKVENKHVSEVHFSFKQGFKVGGGTGNRTISK